MAHTHPPHHLARRPAWIARIPVLCCALATSAVAERARIDLTGAWDFYADIGEATFEQLTQAPTRIVVPGAWQTQGYGEPGGTIPAALLDTETSPADHLRHNLTARCLYVRHVEIPSAWQDHRVFLGVRRVYARADVNLNGVPFGEHDGFSSPYEFDVTGAVRFGAANRLVIGVDNRPRRGSITYGTANWFANWGGFGGDVYLEARPALRVRDVFAMPNVAESRVILRVELSNDTGSASPDLQLDATVALAGDPDRAGDRPAAVVSRASRTLAAGDSGHSTNASSIDLTVDIPHARLWSPETPFLYTAQVRLFRDDRALDELSVRFGMREIAARGRQLLLNGRPLYLSGYGDDATEPITGMLPNDKAVYRRRLELMRRLGFNFVRHHSCIPHDEYLEAADEVGMLVQPEAGMAYTKFWPTAHRQFEREWPLIVRAFRNHPCIWAWCAGNELFLDQLPEGDADARALALTEPVTQGPLRTVAVEDNGVYGPPGRFPTRSFKQSNYYRDVVVLVEGQERSLLGQSGSRRIFDDGPHELGLKFSSSRPGLVTRLRYFRVPEEQGPHTGRLWDENGRQLAQAEFTHETASGWQETTLPQAVPIEADRVYVVSVNANTAYAATPGGQAQFTRGDALALMEQAYRQAKQLDPTRLMHASDGGSVHPFTDVVSPGSWLGENREETRPRLLHEYGTYTCSLPDFSLIPRLDGIIRSITYERAERYVRERQLEAVYPRLRRSSLLMRADAQKYYVEAAKARDGNSGFSFWLGVDFPDSPEGCWDEGILNQLWEPKPYLTNGLPDILGPTVLLCDAGLDARSFYDDAPKRVAFSLWHYGDQLIADARLAWRVVERDKVLQSGETAGITCGLGQRVPVGDVVIAPLPGTRPRFLRLEVELHRGTQRLTGNTWEFYAYPRIPPAAALPGVYSEAGDLPGASVLSTNAPFPEDLRMLITRELTEERHAALLEKGRCAILLLGNAGFKETRAGYFLNHYGSGFGGIIEDHPVFDRIPHDGRLHLGLYQVIAGGALLDAETMPKPLRDGAVVWGLKLTAWVSPVKDLNKALHWSEVLTDRQLHLVLCGLDLATDKPESRYVLAQAIHYLLEGPTGAPIERCATSDLQPLLQ